MFRCVFISLFLAAIGGGIPLEDTEIQSDICLDAECVIASGEILSALDRTADPCQDFYRYACGGWLDKAEIEPWSTRKSKSFGEASHANLKVIKKILETKPTQTINKSLQKALDIYTACMDVNAMETTGATPLQTLIDSFGGWSVSSTDEDVSTKSPPDFLSTLLAVHGNSIHPLFSVGVGADGKHSSQNIIHISQSGLGLGSRGLYLGRHEQLLEAYVEFGTTLATLLAEDDGLEAASLKQFKVAAKERMMSILAFEKELAKIIIPKSTLRDPWKSYHKMTLKEFSAMIPTIDVFAYMRHTFGKEIPPNENVLVPTKEYFPELNKLMLKTPPSVMHDYMVWQLVAKLSGLLPERYRAARLKFLHALHGTPAAAPRWMTCAATANKVMGFATAAEFLKTQDSGVIKDEVSDMIENVRDMFVENLPYVDWMDDTTKALARQKAQAIVDKVVAPEWIKDENKVDQHYAKLHVGPESHFGNTLNILAFHHHVNLAKYQQPVDKNEWHMIPVKTNAYYSPVVNQMVFPVGILQSPFYNPALPMSLNYGSIGWVIGHELTHGFDDMGRNFDAVGNLHNWWKNQSAQAYKERAECIRNQYNGYKVGENHVNGKLTLGENIADNGGIRLALHAYETYKDQGGQDYQLPGLQDMTPEQLFFIAAGQTWCMLTTPEMALLKLLGDPHSPGKYRVIGTLSNTKEFTEAFQCPAGTTMNPANKCRVW